MGTIDDLVNQIARRETDRVANEREASIKAMLGCWISETEPSIVYGPKWALLGLAGPNGTVVVRPCAPS